MNRRNEIVFCAGLAVALAALPFSALGLQTSSGEQTVDKAGSVRNDCEKLKGKPKSACQVKAQEAASKNNPQPTSDDKFAFPEEESRHGGELQRNQEMPTTGVPDPPSESMKPTEPVPVDSLPSNPDNKPSEAPAKGGDGGLSGTSSSNTNNDDDAAPTTSASDTPIKASPLKDLGSHADLGATRAKLEETRVEDDLKVGHFYMQDGNLAGAKARYTDALTHEPDNADAHFGIAQILLKEGKKDEAAGHLRRYLQLAPDDDHTRDAQKLLAKTNAR